METTSLAGLLLVAAIGVVIGVLIGRARSAGEARALSSQLQSERAVAAHRIAELSEDHARSSSVQALVAPVSASLESLAGRIERAERARTASQAELGEQLRAMAAANVTLREETGRLVHALNRSEFRGRWGEAQLRRVVEAAGLVNGVDFVEQVTVVSADATLRPDMVITLSNNRRIVVDAKVALDALLAPQPSGGDDPAAAALMLRRHAAAVGAHIDQLSSKQYWRQFPDTPEFVVMFLPAESLLGTALATDPGLLERAFARNVVLATPSTLLALLRAVAMGWRDEALAENARAIHESGRELHTRLQVMSGHLSKLGSALDTAVSSYNKAIGSYEGRVMVTARKMSDLGGSNESHSEVSQIDRTTRSIAGVAAAIGGDD